MNEPVLDSSALLAFLQDEPGAEAVADVLHGASMSAVNLAEVISKLCGAGATSEAAWAIVSETGVSIVDTDAAQALDIAALHPLTRHLGLSLGDRACLALARRYGTPVFTADEAWAGLKGSDVVLIRAGNQAAVRPP